MNPIHFESRTGLIDNLDVPRRRLGGRWGTFGGSRCEAGTKHKQDDQDGAANHGDGTCTSSEHRLRHEKVGEARK